VHNTRKTQTLSCYEIQDKQNQKITKHTQETKSRTYPRAVSHDTNCIRCIYNVDDNIITKFEASVRPALRCSTTVFPRSPTFANWEITGENTAKLRFPLCLNLGFAAWAPARLQQTCPLSLGHTWWVPVRPAGCPAGVDWMRLGRTVRPPLVCFARGQLGT